MTIELAALHDFARDEDEDHAEVELEEDAEPVQSWIERWSPLVAVLSGAGDDLEDVLDDLDSDALAASGEYPAEELTILKEGFSSLEADLAQQIKDALEHGITEEDALKIGAQLEETDVVPDGLKLAGWLRRLAAIG